MPFRFLRFFAALPLVLFGCKEETADRVEKSAIAGGPRRVIALAPNAAEVICAMNGCDRLVGVSDFCVYPPEIAELPRIGGLRDPDLELVVSLKPDLVILRGVTGPLRDYCERFNVPTHHDDLESLEDVYRTIDALGRLLELGGGAESLIETIKVGLDEVAGAVKGRSRPRVLLTLRSPASLSDIFSVNKGTFLDALIGVGGGENVYHDAAELYPAVALEDVVRLNPEVIIEAMAGETVDEPAAQAQWSAFATVSAVRDDRVHVLTESYITIPSQRVVLTARDFAGVIHPDVKGAFGR